MNTFEKENQISLEERIKDTSGVFKVVESNPNVGELTEKELESLCDPEYDATGLCLGIVEKIRGNNDLDKGTLVEEMLEGGMNVEPEEAIKVRFRIENAVEKMIKYGFLKINSEMNNAVESKIV